MNFLDVTQVVVSQECRSLLQTLPSEKGWVITDDIYLYRGFWYTPPQLNGVLSVQQNDFEGADQYSDMTLLATLPKAGTTWLKALIFTLLNRSEHSPNSNNHPLLQENPHQLVRSLETTDLTAVEGHSPRLFSTHNPFSTLPSSIASSNCKIVYLCRNPKDTFISLWHFANKVKPIGSNKISLDDAFDKFCHGASPFGPYWDHVMEYWKASQEMPDKVLFVKFEDIKEQPGKQLRRMARFLECPFSQEEESSGQVEEIVKLCSFNSLSGLEVNRNGKLWSNCHENNVFFRKGEVGDSVNYFTDEMIERVDRITEEKLSGSTLML